MRRGSDRQHRPLHCCVEAETTAGVLALVVHRGRVELGAGRWVELDSRHSSRSSRARPSANT